MAVQTKSRTGASRVKGQVQPSPYSRPELEVRVGRGSGLAAPNMCLKPRTACELQDCPTRYNPNGCGDKNPTIF